MTGGFGVATRIMFDIARGQNPLTYIILNIHSNTVQIVKTGVLPQ